ncbi:MAG: hypothetical protein NVS2B5_05770 [Beijerinckiaceae bacterium]
MSILHARLNYQQQLQADNASMGGMFGLGGALGGAVMQYGLPVKFGLGGSASTTQSPY